jgi:hypothetical protein
MIPLIHDWVQRLNSASECGDFSHGQHHIESYSPECAATRRNPFYASSNCLNPIALKAPDKKKYRKNGIFFGGRQPKLSKVSDPDLAVPNISLRLEMKGATTFPLPDKP